MPRYSRLVSFAKITSVRRENGDVVLSVRDAVRGSYLRYFGTVTFVEVSGVESIDTRNDLVQRELVPGWKVDGMGFEDGVATLGARQEGCHESFGVRHTIRCAGVRLRLRPAVLRTLRNYLSTF